MLDRNHPDMETGILIRAGRFRDNFKLDTVLADHVMQIPQDPQEPAGVRLDAGVQENKLLVYRSQGVIELVEPGSFRLSGPGAEIIRQYFCMDLCCAGQVSRVREKPTLVPPRASFAAPAEEIESERPESTNDRSAKRPDDNDNAAAHPTTPGQFLCQLDDGAPGVLGQQEVILGQVRGVIGAVAAGARAERRSRAALGRSPWRPSRR
jgi:hypothetical protein